MLEMNSDLSNSWKEIMLRTRYNEDTGRFEILRKDLYMLKEMVFGRYVKE